MKLFTPSVFSFAELAMAQSTGAGNPVLWLYIIAQGTFIVVMINICAWFFRVKWFYFHCHAPFILDYSHMQTHIITQ